MLTADSPEYTRSDQPIAMTVIITNTSSVTANDVHLHMSIDSDLFEVPGTPYFTISTDFTNCPVDPNCQVFSVPGRVGDLPGEVVITLGTLTASEEACGMHQVSASMEHESIVGSLSAETVLNVTCDPHFEVDVSVDKTNVDPLEEFEYTINVTNVGIGDFDLGGTGLIPLFEAELPPEFDNYDIAYNGAAFGCDMLNIGNRIFDCSVRQNFVFAPGHTETFSFELTLNPGSESQVCQDGLSAPISILEHDYWPGANELTLPTVMIDCGLGPLIIGLATVGTTAEFGERFQYEVEVGNPTFAPYTGLFRWELTLPEGLEFDYDSVPALCTIGTNDGLSTLNCITFATLTGITFATPVPVIAPYASAKHICQGASSSVPVSVSATVTGTEGDWNPARSIASASINLNCPTSGFMTVSADHPVVKPGETAVFTYSAINPLDQYFPMGFGAEFPVEFADSMRAETGMIFNCIRFYDDFLSCNTAYAIPGNGGETTSLQIYLNVDNNPSDAICAEGISVSAYLMNGFAASDDAHTTSATALVNCQQLSLTKITSAESVVLGDEFTYTVIVTNDGRNSHGSYAFTDTLPPGIELVDPTDLPEGCEGTQSAGTTTITCTRDTGPDPTGGIHQYTFRVQSDFALNTDICGEVTNTVTGTDGVWVTGSATADITVDCPVEITFSKEPISATVNPGGTIGYEITLQNLSLIPMTYLALIDDPPTLPDGGSWTLYINGEVFDPNKDLAPLLESRDPIVFRFVSSEIPEDITTESAWCGEWRNTATVDITFANGAELHDEASARLFVNCSSLSIVKAVNSELIAPGGEVEYTITVTNDGNTDIDTLVVVDRVPTTDAFTNWQVTSNLVETRCAVEPDLSGDLIAYCFLPILPRDTALEMTLTGEAPPVPTWEQCAPVENIATFLYFSSSPPAQVTRLAELTPPITEVHSNTVTTQVDCQPDVDITKAGAVDTGEDGRVDAGDMITYTFEVTNSGNMALYDITITENLPGLEWVSGTTIEELAPGASGTLTATFAVTQADIDTGEVVNTAEVTASTVPETGPIGESGPPGETGTVTTLQDAPGNTTPTSVSAATTATTALEQVPEIDLVKSSDGDDLESGDTITYTFTVTNTDNVTLTDLDVLDGMEGVTFDGETTIDELALGEDAQLTATYTVTQANVDAGIIVNCADVTAIAPGESTVSDDDCATDLIDQNPLLQLAYACQGPTDAFLPDVGDEVTFELTISNDGDQTLHDLAMESSRDGELDTDLPSSLAPGETATRTWTTTVSQDDYDAREIEVEVTVTGQTEAGFEATLTSAIAMQADSSVTTSITMTCPMAEVPSTSTPQPVTKLPETGHGMDVFTPGLWAAAMAGLVLIGISGVRIRRNV